MNYLEHIGKYFMMLRQVFKRPQKWKVFREMLLREIDDLGLKSLGIISTKLEYSAGVIIFSNSL